MKEGDLIFVPPDYDILEKGCIFCRSEHRGTKRFDGTLGAHFACGCAFAITNRRSIMRLVSMCMWIRPHQVKDRLLIKEATP